jgi:hypothetical protein
MDGGTMGALPPRRIGAGVAYGPMTTDEIVLFGGQLDTQRVRVWLQRRADGGIALLSHDIGPKLEFAFGTDEIETFLEIEAAQLPALAAALGDPAADPIALLASRYAGDSMATTHLRELLAEHDIPHRFSVI